MNKPVQLGRGVFPLQKWSESPLNPGTALLGRVYETVSLLPTCETSCVFLAQ